MPKISHQAELSAEILNELNGQEYVMEIVCNPDTAHFKCLLDLPKRVAIEVCDSAVTPTATVQEMPTALNPECAITERELIIESLGRGRASAKENILSGPNIRDSIVLRLIVI